MTLQSSGPISLGQIQTEFFGSDPIGINEYYKSGVYVANTTTNAKIPTSGIIKFSDFYGSRRAIFGCTSPSATNYNPSANENNGTCIFIIRGCTSPSATNYNPSANQDDGSCTFPPPPTFDVTFFISRRAQLNNFFIINGNVLTVSDGETVRPPGGTLEGSRRTRLTLNSNQIYTITSNRPKQYLRLSGGTLGLEDLDVGDPSYDGDFDDLTITPDRGSIYDFGGQGFAFIGN